MPISARALCPVQELSLALRQGKGFLGIRVFAPFYGQGIKEPRSIKAFGSNACFPGNPSLRPERSKTWSVGMEQKLASDRVFFRPIYFFKSFL